MLHNNLHELTGEDSWERNGAKKSNLNRLNIYNTRREYRNRNLGKGRREAMAAARLRGAFQDYMTDNSFEVRL